MNRGATWGGLCSVEEPLGFDVFLADPMGFKPAQFRSSYRAIHQLHHSDALEFSPPASTIPPTESAALTY
jgi:hypothetical protein